MNTNVSDAHIQRTPRIATLAARIRIDAFCAAVSRATRATVIERSPACEPYETDVLHGRGAAGCVLLPSVRDEVCTIARLAGEHGVPLVAQGARTGLVGAAVPDATGTQCVLSLAKLDRVIDFDVANRSVTVEAGMRLSALERVIAAHGLQFPIDIGSDPSIGGLVATNAGGSRLLKCGDVRRNVLGIEIVLADGEGTRIDALAPLRKNNTGIDVKQLFIGAGGALGIVTAASFELRKRDRSSAAFFVALPDLAACAAMLVAFEEAFGELLAAFEFIAAHTYAATLAAFFDLRAPLRTDAGACFVLVELATAMPGLDALLEARGTELLARLSDEGIVKDAAIDAAADFWRVRDAVPVAFTTHGVPLPFDVAFTRTRLAPFAEELKRWMAHAHPRLTLHAFGHFGDGGAHLIVLIPNEERERYGAARCALLRSHVYRMVLAHGGSFSAEHGIGPANFAHYRQFSPEPQRALAARLQSMFDPYRVVGRCRYDAAVDTFFQRKL